MNDIKIDADIPIKASYNNGRPEKYPWRKMEVGDSFFVSSETMNLKRASTYAWDASRRTGRKFACRRQDDGIRIWRIS